MEKSHPKVAFSYILRLDDMHAAVNKAYIRNTIDEMADGQTPFEYTEAELDTLVEFISTERLQLYIASIKFYKDPVDRLRKAVRFYERNTAYSEALYPVIQGFEITLRNAIHNRLTLDHHANWFDTIELLQSEKDAIADARRIIQDKPEAVTPGRVIGELSCGFWIRLFASEYAETLWGPSLSRLLTPATNDRRAVYSRLKDIKTLRNRIAHHNRIVGRTPTVQQMYDQILETIGWLSPTMRSWVASTNSLEGRLARKTIAVSPRSQRAP